MKMRIVPGLLVWAVVAAGLGTRVHAADLSLDGHLVLDRVDVPLRELYPETYGDITHVTLAEGVTTVPDGLFAGCTNLTSVTVPSSVTRIREGGFSGCSGLTSFVVAQDNSEYSSVNGLLLSKDGRTLVCGVNGRVTIPDGVTSIGYEAFYGYSGLTSVTIPEGVTEIGSSAFSGCSGLASVTIPDGVTSIGWSAFDDCADALFDSTSIPGVRLVDGWVVGWNEGVAANLDLSGVRGLADGAFCGCEELVSVRIPSGVTHIGDWSFSGCSGLMSVAIPDSVTSIGDNAFSYCIGLASVKIPSGVTHIGDSAFSGCNGLRSVTIPDSVTSIGEYAFSDCSSLTSAAIPASVTSVGYGVFVGCTAIQRIELNCNLKDLDGYELAFGDIFDACESVTEIVLGPDVTSIGEGAFSGYAGLTSVRIPDGVTRIGGGAFDGCGDALFDVTTIPGVRLVDGWVVGWSEGVAADLDLSGVRGLADGAFRGCKGLVSVTLPGSVTRIGDSMFSGCSGLMSAAIPAGVTSIGDCAFEGCSSLTSVTIPASVTSVGWSAFKGCTALRRIELNGDLRDFDGNELTFADLFSDAYESVTEIVLGSGVTRIGDYAFSDFSGLASVTIPSGVTRIGEGAFYGCGGLTSVALPAGVTNIGNNAFYGCGGLTSVVLPDGVTSIGEGAFYGCGGLMSVAIPSSVTNIGDSAFSDCSGLTSVAIPDGVTRIGNSVFSGCSGLTSVTIPASVMSIDGSAFEGCGAIRRVELNRDLRDLDGKALRFADLFAGSREHVTEVVLGTGVTHIGDGAFEGFSRLRSVTIPDSVTRIGCGAFDGCVGALFDTATIPGAYLVDGWVVGWNMGIAEDLDLSGVCGLADGAFCGCGWLVSVRIPDGVTSIGASAFSGCSGLTSVVIPNSVRRIGGGAFEGCGAIQRVELNCDLRGFDGVDLRFADLFAASWEHMTEIVLGAGVTRIGDSAFSGCSRLTSVTIPNGVTRIGDWAFEGCSGLMAVTISDGVTSIGDGAFSGCSSLTSVTIPDGVTRIGEGAFSGCSGLMSVAISDGVTSIGDRAFSGCSGLTSVAIPDGVRRIGDGAFSGCSGLMTVTIPASVTGIGDDAFEGCTAIWRVELNCDLRSLDGEELTVGSLFADSWECMTEIVLGAGVTRIGDGAFSGFCGLMSVRISDGVTHIGCGAFDGCADALFDTTTIPGVCLVDGWVVGWGEGLAGNLDLSGVRGLADGAFSGCSGLTSVTIPVGVTCIGNSAFSGCSGLTSVTIPVGVTCIGNSAFSGCSGLASVTIPSGVTEIGWRAFSGCSGLTSLTIPASVTGVGYDAFDGCAAIRRIELNCDLRDLDGNELTVGSLFADSRECMTEIVLGTGVTSIGEGAFSGFCGLMSVRISDGVTHIGCGAFDGCADVLFDTTTIPGVCLVDGWVVGWGEGLAGNLDLSGVRGLADGAFYGCERLVSVRIPNGVTRIGDSAFSGCSGLTSVTIPESVTSVGCGAFDGCDDALFDDMTIPGARLVDGWVVGWNEGVATNLDLSGARGLADELQFGACEGLVSVRLPTSMTRIGDFAFSGCSGLTSLVIPTGVTSIGWKAFEGCSGLTSVVIPASVTGIEDTAFWGCASIRRVELNCDLRNLDGEELRFADLFADSREHVAEVVLGTGVTYIGEGMFSGFSGLTSVTMSDGVTRIGDSAFSGCSDLVSVTIPASVANIGDRAFSDCGSLASVRIPDGVTRIGDSAFSGCSGLSSVTIPASVTRIGCEAFDGCADALFDATTIPGVRLVDGWVVGWNEGVAANLDLSEVRGLADGAFAGCMELESVVLPNNLTRMGDRTFLDCSALTAITIPESVIDLGAGVFAGCTALRRVQFLGDAPAVDADAYADAPADLVTYVVSGTRGWDGRADSTALPAAWPVGTPYALRTWTPPCVRVTFDTQGGEPATVVLEEAIGKTYRLPQPAPTRLGATFLGWWTEAGAEVRPTTRVVLTGDHVLYARWRLRGYTVAFDANGGVGAMAPVARTVGAAAALPPAAFRRAGHDFAGWALKPDGEAAFADGADPGDLAYGDEVILYAAWRKRAWTAADWLDAPGLAFSCAGDADWRPDAAESHDGIGSMRSGALGTAPEGTTVRSTLKTVVRGQGVLSFWWKVNCEPGDPETGDLYDFLELTVDGVRPASVAPLAGETDWARVEVRLDGASAHEVVWAFVKDDWDNEMVVYADAAWVDEVTWAPDAVSFSFDGNGATDGAAPDRIAAFSGAEVVLPGPGTLVRDGCRFVGWNDGERTYAAGETYVADVVDVTFMAIWKVLSLGDVLNAPGLSVTTGGDSAWRIDSAVCHDGEAALRSGAVAAGQASWVETTVTGAGTLAFWWKADGLMYRGKPANYVDVSVDGAVAATAAEADWTLVTVAVEGSGAHVVRWTYRRTRVQTVGETCAWLDEVAWTPASMAPGIVGDADAAVTGDAASGFVVVPGAAAETVEVTVPDGLDPEKVTVAVPPAVKTVRPNGAKVRVVRGGHDITAYLDIPAAVNGVVAVGEATVKDAIAREPLDPDKGAVVALGDASKPSLVTAPTRPGLVYTLREGAALDAMADGDMTVGDGKAWTPALTVKGGASGFYSIRVSK